MEKQHAIVIDDDVQLANSFQMILNLCGFDVEVVNDSRLAVDKIREIQPTLITLDLQMPHVTGLDILQAIRADETIANTKVIMLTASSYISQDESIFDLADLVLSKPASVKQIQDFAVRLTT